MIADLPYRLNRDELPEDTVELAQFLLSKIIVRILGKTILTGRIVETEAYLSTDAASHSFRGITPRNKSMFLRHGHAYVYLAYGTSYMLNVSSGEEGQGEGVLIRAMEPISGLEVMLQHRGTVPHRDIGRGPGRLAKAFAIDKELDGIDLCSDDRLWLADDGFKCSTIGQSTRIGITRDADRILRFFVAGHRCVSGSVALNRYETQA